MSHAVDLGPIVRIADGAIEEFSIVKLTGGGGAAQSSQASGIGDQHGVVMEIKSAIGSTDFGNPAAAGDAVEVHLYGIVRVRAGAAFDAGDPLMSDENGFAIATEPANYAILDALEEATAANHIVYAAIRKGTFATGGGPP